MPTVNPVSKPIRALVIGAGPAGVQMHLPVLARLRDRGEIALKLVCDIQSERAHAAREGFGFQAQIGDAARALGRPDIDAVYIFGSAQMHYEYGVAALRAGKHLFVEKPIAPSYAQACEMARMARERGLIAAAGHNRRFYRSLVAVRARAGRTGWRFAEAVFHKPEFGKPPLFGARTWLSANGIHALDALVFMMGGLPERLTALAGEAGAAQPGAFSALMRWPDGAQGTFLCNNNAGSRREEYVFHGPGETCTVTAKGLTVEKDGSVLETPLPSIGDGVAAEHEAFLHAIRSSTQPVHSIEAIAPSIFLAELIEEGSSGRVQLPVIEPAPASSRIIYGASVLVAQPAGLQSALARLLPHHALVSLDDIRTSPERRTDITAAILGPGSPPLPQDILDKLPGLAVVGIVGLSLARYAPEALLARDIALVNASEAYAGSVAEFAFALAILGRRRAFLSHEIMRGGGWGTDRRTSGLRGLLRSLARNARPAIAALGLEPFALRILRAGRAAYAGPAMRTEPRDLRGARVGLIGWSANARDFAARLLQAQTRVLVYSEHASPAGIKEAGAVPASLREVLAADVVSLHRGLNKNTWHCLGAVELAQLRPGAVLINVARGALIDPQALLERLRQGDIFACLDTYEMEPLASTHPLRKLPNVFLTSHIAGGSPDMDAAAADEVVRKVAAYLAGHGVESISADRLRTMT